MLAKCSSSILITSIKSIFSDGMLTRTPRVTTPAMYQRLLFHLFYWLLVPISVCDFKLQRSIWDALMRIQVKLKYCIQAKQSVLSGWWFQPLWKIWKSVGIIIPNIWKVIIQSPPTSYGYKHLNFSLLAAMLYPWSKRHTAMENQASWNVLDLPRRFPVRWRRSVGAFIIPISLWFLLVIYRTSFHGIIIPFFNGRSSGSNTWRYGTVPYFRP